MEGLPAYWDDLAVQHSVNAAATASIFMNYDLDKPRMVSHVIPVAGVTFNLNHLYDGPTELMEDHERSFVTNNYMVFHDFYN